MRLSELIQRLETQPQHAVVHLKGVDGDEWFPPHPGSFMSWRGVYAELGLEPSDAPCTVAELLERARACIGATFQGYKGGEYTMSERTLVHVASYGESGNERLVSVQSEGDSRCNLIVATVETW